MSEHRFVDAFCVGIAREERGSIGEVREGRARACAMQEQAQAAVGESERGESRMRNVSADAS